MACGQLGRPQLVHSQEPRGEAGVRDRAEDRKWPGKHRLWDPYSSVTGRKPPEPGLTWKTLRPQAVLPATLRLASECSFFSRVFSTHPVRKTWEPRLVLSGRPRQEWDKALASAGDLRGTKSSATQTNAILMQPLKIKIHVKIYGKQNIHTSNEDRISITDFSFRLKAPLWLSTAPEREAVAPLEWRLITPHCRPPSPSWWPLLLCPRGSPGRLQSSQ